MAYIHIYIINVYVKNLYMYSVDYNTKTVVTKKSKYVHFCVKNYLGEFLLKAVLT